MIRDNTVREEEERKLFQASRAPEVPVGFGRRASMQQAPPAPSSGWLTSDVEVLERLAAPAGRLVVGSCKVDGSGGEVLTALEPPSR